jgi:hypothetical protein
MVEVTSLTRATPKSQSLRTTVPAFIIKLYDLKEHDQLQWDIKPTKTGEITITVKPIKKQA